MFIVDSDSMILKQAFTFFIIAQHKVKVERTHTCTCGVNIVSNRITEGSCREVYAPLEISFVRENTLFKLYRSLSAVNIVFIPAKLETSKTVLFLSCLHTLKSTKTKMQ